LRRRYAGPPTPPARTFGAVHTHPPPAASVDRQPQVPPLELAALDQPAPDSLRLSGPWTAHGIARLEGRLRSVALTAGAASIDCAGILALDTAGAWVLGRLLVRLRTGGRTVTVQALRPAFTTLLELVDREASAVAGHPAAPRAPAPGALARLGARTLAAGTEARALLVFLGETALALGGSLAHPARLRWRPFLYNIETAGVAALPIVGLLAFMLGVVVAYQGADQLRQYGANIYVTDLIGLSMLREFAPLITAIIIAGRSGSAYAAQIGTMAVTEELDAMRTLGISPTEMLVLPKLAALLVAVPLLTVWADFLGVAGGMVMAKIQLGVGYTEFLERFVNAVSITTYTVGLGKTPVFAVIIAVIGCFQGFATKNDAESVGRHTTRAVVQTIFLVIVADGLFSVVFSALDL
jgi:phospholipid/cholesterol/gamma-HCH transport system permease protein